jgi:hypothetical protein
VECILSPLYQQATIADATLPCPPLLQGTKIHRLKKDCVRYQPIYRVVKNHSIRSLVACRLPNELQIFLFTKFYI